MLENPTVQAATRENVRFLLTHDYWQPMATQGLYRPLTMLSYLLDWTVFGFGSRPAGYIAENVLLHLACAALVYALLWRLTGRLWPAIVAAALFALHPITTEV